MASHLPIGQAGFDMVFKHIVKKLHITRLNNFQKEFMDKFVVYFYRFEDDYSYEVHLDKELNVNQVYQVL